MLRNGFIAMLVQTHIVHAHRRWEEMGLVAVPQLAQYRDFYFASFDRDFGPGAGPLFVESDRTRRAGVMRARKRRGAARGQRPAAAGVRVRSELANVNLAGDRARSLVTNMRGR